MEFNFLGDFDFSKELVVAGRVRPSEGNRDSERQEK